MQAGESLRVSTIEYEDDSRVKWLCLRYVEGILSIVVAFEGGYRRWSLEAIMNLCYGWQYWAHGLIRDFRSDLAPTRKPAT